MSDTVDNPLDDPDADPFEIAAQRRRPTSHASPASSATTSRSRSAAGGARPPSSSARPVATVPADARSTGFAPARSTGHVGTLRSVRLPKGKHALVIGARTHFYEGHGVRASCTRVRTAPPRPARDHGAHQRRRRHHGHWTPGSPVLICDHINLTGATPRSRARPSSISPTSTRCACATSRGRSIPSLDEGVYCQFRGPQYETPAEVQMAKAIGGHIVGHVDRARGDRRPSGGHGGARLLAHHEPRRRHPDRRRSATPRSLEAGQGRPQPAHLRSLLGRRATALNRAPDAARRSSSTPRGPGSRRTPIRRPVRSSRRARSSRPEAGDDAGTGGARPTASARGSRSAPRACAASSARAPTA